MGRIPCACILAIKQNPWMNLIYFVVTSMLIEARIGAGGGRLISVFMLKRCLVYVRLYACEFGVLVNESPDSVY